MQIKVKDTRMHKTTTYNDKTFGGILKEIEVPIAEGKLVLIDNLQSSHEIKVNGIYCHSILISETEKIERNDFVLDNETNDIIKATIEMAKTNNGYWSKILAMPENFSSKHLQAIVDGKMKDGDKVLIECEQLRSEEINSPFGKINIVMAKSPHNNESNSDMSVYKHFIKLNSSNHITLHKVEEKQYKKDEIKQILYDYASFLGQRDGQSLPTIEPLNNWFEQNVK